MLLFGILLSANELKTVYSYQNAVNKAKHEGKYVLVMMSYAQCPVCHYMKDIVLERPKVLDYLNAHYYVVIKDLERDRYPERFSVIDSPAFFFIDPVTEKETVPRVSGGFRPDAFLQLLKEGAGDTPKKEDENATLDKNGSMTPCHKARGCVETPKITIQ